MTTTEKPFSKTHTSQDGEGKSPRLPHEHDESSDSQEQEDVRPVIRQAHDDIESGIVDTDKGKPLDEAYQRQKAGGKPTASKE